MRNSRFKISVTEAARSFSDLVNRVHYKGETFVVERGGEPVCEISPVAPVRFTSAEFVQLLSQSPRPDHEYFDLIEELNKNQPRFPELGQILCGSWTTGRSAMKTFASQIYAAVRLGKLAEPFNAAMVKRACPGWADRTYHVFLSKHAVGNGATTELFIKVAHGLYKLKNSN